LWRAVNLHAAWHSCFKQLQLFLLLFELSLCSALHMSRVRRATWISCFNILVVFCSLLRALCCLQKFGMTDIASFGVSFESNDLHLPAVAGTPAKDAAAAGKAAKSKSKKGKKGAAVEEEAVEPLASSKSGHVLKNLLPAGE
jgi:hypothetical protein